MKTEWGSDIEVLIDKNNIINHLTNIDSNIKKNREKRIKHLQA